MGSTAKNLDQEIINYLPQLNDKQKKTALTVVKTFMEEQKDWWDENGEAQQKAIDKSLSEMKIGELITHSEAMKKYRR